MTPSILIVEDEIKIAELLRDYLQHAGYNCQLCHDGAHVIEQVKRQSFNVILLDLMLPGRDGISLCQEIRRFSDVPVIMLTAKVAESDRLLGLESGADDYICKPFSPREVVARVKAILRRVAQPVTSAEASVSLDPERLEVSYQDAQPLALTVVEFQLLKALVDKPGRILSRNRLMQLIYPDHRIVSDRTIDSHIKKLRKKLAEQFGDNEWISTVYGAGYRFQIEE